MGSIIPRLFSAGEAILLFLFLPLILTNCGSSGDSDYLLRYSFREGGERVWNISMNVTTAPNSVVADTVSLSTSFDLTERALSVYPDGSAELEVSIGSGELVDADGTIIGEYPLSGAVFRYRMGPDGKVLSEDAPLPEWVPPGLPDGPVSVGGEWTSELDLGRLGPVRLLLSSAERLDEIEEGPLGTAAVISSEYHVSTPEDDPSGIGTITGEGSGTMVFDIEEGAVGSADISWTISSAIPRADGEVIRSRTVRTLRVERSR